MSYKLSDVVYECGDVWVLRDTKQQAYVVFRSGVTHATSDSAYSLDDDGLSLAAARAKYLGSKQKCELSTTV